MGSSGHQQGSDGAPDGSGAGRVADRDWARKVQDVRAAKRRRLELTVDQRPLVDEVSALLFAADPVGIDFGENTDEYDGEAETIVIALPGTTDARAVAPLVHRVFVEWFDPRTAGPVERYRAVSAGIWSAWQRNQGQAGLPSPA